MEFFIDTANVDDIREAASWGIICGVTTNPSLIAREGRKLIDVIKEITDLVNGPISAEVKEASAEEMVEEAFGYARLHPNIVIKIPMTFEGLKAVKVLSSNRIPTNVTLVFSVPQALMAAKAGATYVSPFLGRLDDYTKSDHAGYELLEDIRLAFDNYDIQTKIIAASIRHPEHVTQAALAGAEIATIPFKVLKEMIEHPLTTKGLEIFRNAGK
ncbi:MAG TPA: fructose-6-phosphate aldolase [Bacillota bacterium]|nr:fructose-6-phosphate aldolase [Bacillota bacterium]HPF41965.1 fructose-6-phosphate aldolase [Bacillota bacterium]HPJ85562.1 fructose-6-phosphate aldolase [Bacillota bacterium]HPQ61486.1 fructose-6-phosphate aldolase [Bacillota bacterium]HRX92020.1 fructose-6-phosphate aldolase [Candidatus Izemoplasmatales bacterium]